MKICSKCKVEKDLSEFYADKRWKSGKQSACKKCSNLAVRDWQKRHKDRCKVAVDKWRLKNPENKAKCQKIYRTKHADKFKASVQRSKDANPEKYRAIRRKHYLANREEHYQKSRQWMKDHPEYVRACAKARNARVKQATPRWAKTGQVMADIREFYLNCPEGYHVDHKVPLVHSLVSGLHVPANLQYLPAKENLRKHNNFLGAKINATIFS